MSRSIERYRRAEGFTLIELLVVILVLAILAAIAIPVFLNQREKAWAAQIQSSLKDAATAVESYGVAHGGDFSSLDGYKAETDSPPGALLATEGFQWPSYLQNLQINATKDAYCIEARHNRLTGNTDWRRATYQSAVGVPQQSPDLCTGLP